MKATRRLLTVYVLTSILGACAAGQSSAPVPSCDELGAHFVRVARADLDALSADNRERATQLRPALDGFRQDFVATCREQRWSKSVRKCYAQVETSAEARQLCSPLVAQTRLASESPQ